MRRNIYLVGVLILTGQALAGYDYVISEGYVDLPVLTGQQSLLMTGRGGGPSLDMLDESRADICGTSPLLPGRGGIWMIHQFADSGLNVSGGEIGHISVGAYAHARFSGGAIGNLWSLQGIGSPDPHIEVVCREWNWEEATNFLTGIWEDRTAFTIMLHDTAGYDPVIDNIKFTIIPEPASLAVFGMGAVLAARRRRV